MTDDFIRGLQSDLVEAMARYERRGPRRLLTGRGPRLPRRDLLASAAAAAALALAVAFAADRLTGPAPPARPHVAGVVTIGGMPKDAVFAGGSLWATDYTGEVVRVDPDQRRVIDRIQAPGSPAPIAAGAGSVYVHSERRRCAGTLLRIDASSGRVIARDPLPYASEQAGGLAVDQGLWVTQGCIGGRGVERLDPAGAVSARIPVGRVDEIAAAGGNVWTIGYDGTLTEIDAARGRVEKRWPLLAPQAEPTGAPTETLVADPGGVWVLSTDRAVILRIERGRLARQLAVDPSTQPLLARDRDGLWTVSGGGSSNSLIRIDPATGARSAALTLGDERPVALIPAGDDLCVLTAAGRILFVRS